MCVQESVHDHMCDCVGGDCPYVCVYMGVCDCHLFLRSVIVGSVLVRAGVS